MVKQIAGRVGKTAAQVMLRWNVQLGLATHARTKNHQHMLENLDIFSWQLSESDMALLNGMPACTQVLGLPYDKDDPEGKAKKSGAKILSHDGVPGLFKHC